MKRNWMAVLGFTAVVFGLGAAAGILGWITFTGGDGEASEPISAPTLDINAVPTYSQAQAAELAERNQTLAVEVDTLSTQVAALLESAAPQAADTETAPESPVPTAAEAEPTEEVVQPAASERALFRIEQADSQVRFNIEETMRGNRITVVGSTNEVAGDIAIDFGNPSLSQIGTIRINARTLETDNSFRNRAIRSSILQSASDEYEFSEFVPTSISGLPESVAVGDAIQFQITGDLTVKGTTRAVTFDAEVTVVSEDRIEGLASTTVQYRDFGLTIPPNVPGVTDIGDDVILEIEFVAVRV